MKIGKPEYLEQVTKISGDEKERLLSRMSGKLPRRLQKEKLSIDDALAIQLEIEDEQLQEWREKMHKIRAKLNESLPEQKPAKAKKAEPKKEVPAKVTKPKAAPSTVAKPANQKAAAATVVAKKPVVVKATPKTIKKTPVEK